jgi:hypothetical protein
MERGCRREFFGIEKISYNTRIWRKKVLYINLNFSWQKHLIVVQNFSW